MKYVTLLALAVHALTISPSNQSVAAPTIIPIRSFQPNGTSQYTRTFSGNGYAAQYAGGFEGQFGVWTFDHLHGAIGITTMLQVNISQFSGASIKSAQLNYVLVHGSPETADLQLRSWTSNGVIAHSFWEAPDNLGQVIRPSIGRSANSLDVTPLLQERIDAGADWLGLHLRSTTNNIRQETILFGNPDLAQVRLVVYVIPEPSTLVHISGLLVPLLRRKSRQL